MQNLAALFLGLQQNHTYTKPINFVLAFVQSHSVRTGPTQVIAFIQDTKSADQCSSVNKHSVIVRVTFVKVFRHPTSFWSTLMSISIFICLFSAFFLQVLSTAVSQGRNSVAKKPGKRKIPYQMYQTVLWNKMFNVVTSFWILNCH